ncbi:MAG TPA: SNF2-related protein, partial [bacterium]|nr:SNF2-related protein [bacterium]
AVTRGLEILKTYGLVYFTMEVRTGKTYVSFETLQRAGYRNILFITKKIAIPNIEEQALQFPELSVKVVNYESAHKIRDSFDAVVIDEAHNLGTYPKPSDRWKKVKELCYGRALVFLSGTPTPESWSTIFYQFKLADNCPFSEPNFYRWADNYVNVRMKRVAGGKSVNDYSGAKIKEIQAVISRYQVTVTQQEAGFRKEINESVLEVKMSGYTKLAYNIMLKRSLIEFLRCGSLREPEIIPAESEASLQGKCHQIASGTIKGILNKGLVLDISKALEIRDHAAVHGYRKFAIYYKYVAEFEIIKKVFGRRLIKKPEDFQKSISGVFASQVISGREGLRLDTAQALYMFNIDYAYLSYEQTRNRIQSFERDTVPELIWVFSDLGIEAEIYKKVRKKENFTTRHFRRIFRNSKMEG